MSINKSIQTVESNLIELGYTVRRFDESKILIKDYKLPPGWVRDTTDLLLVVPDGANTMHGISIPNDLSTISGVSMPENCNPNYYKDGWTLISFRLTQEWDDEHFVKHHMDVVRQKLSVM